LCTYLFTYTARFVYVLVHLYGEVCVHTCSLIQRGLCTYLFTYTARFVSTKLSVKGKRGPSFRIKKHKLIQITESNTC